MLSEIILASALIVNGFSLIAAIRLASAVLFCDKTPKKEPVVGCAPEAGKDEENFRTLMENIDHYYTTKKPQKEVKPF